MLNSSEVTTDIQVIAKVVLEERPSRLSVSAIQQAGQTIFIKNWSNFVSSTGCHGANWNMIKASFVAGEVLITILMACYLHYWKLFLVTSRNVLVSSLNFVQSEFIIYTIVLCKNIFLCGMTLLVENLLYWGKCIAPLCRVFANRVTYMLYSVGTCVYTPVVSVHIFSMV